jgi:photosystem II stability/assembly factor-like uncharacterized protein
MKRAFALAVYVCFSIGVMAQWKWQNPLPQGYTLTSVTFPTWQTGYMAGHYGTILKTTDQGETYTILSTGTHRNLNAIYFSDELNGIAIGDSGTIITTTDGGVSWAVQSTGIGPLKSLSFIDADTGYVTGLRTLGFVNTGFIQKTTDGGATWTEILTSPLYEFNTILFTDDHIGFVAGIRHPQYECFILKTTDAGNTWHEMKTPYCQGDVILSLFFTDAQTGYAGSSFSIFRTLDSGQNWVRMDSISFNNYAIHFVDDMTGFAAGGYFDPYWGIAPGHIYSTYDGGMTWQKSNTYQRVFYGLAFPDIHTGIAVGDDGIILKTPDQGVTWQTYSEVYEGLNKIIFTDENTGYACGSSGTVLSTSNGGSTWQNISFDEPFHVYLTDIQFISTDTGFISGTSFGRPIDRLYTTYDGSKSWRLDSLDVGKEFQRIWFRSSTHAFALAAFSSTQGRLYTSVDKGFTWTPVNLGPYPIFWDIAFSDDLTGIIVGNEGTILRTDDGGISWDPVSSGTTESLHKIWFYNAATGYIIGGNEILLKTDDGGLTWNQLPGTPFELNYGIQDIFFPSETVGYLITQEEFFKTIDGGLTWESIPGNLPLYGRNSMYFTDDNNGYVAGIGGRILKTTNGGITFTEEPAFSAPGTIVIYPNPANTHITIMCDMAFENTTIRLLSFDGRVLKTTAGKDNYMIEMEVEKWPSGMYFVEITGQGMREIHKLVLLRP